MTKIILLSSGVATLVDDDVYEWARHSKWSGGYGSGSMYAKRGVRINGRQANEYLHRLIAAPPDGMEVDHINADPLDNRRVNLRIVTRSQNEQAKKRARSDSKSGIRGVGFTRQGKPRAIAWVNGQRFATGPLATIEEAAAAARALRQRLMTHAPECKASESW